MTDEKEEKIDSAIVYFSGVERLLFNVEGE